MKLTLKSIIDPQFTSVYTYNPEGLLSKEAITGTGESNYEYYADNQLKKEASTIGSTYERWSHLFEQLKAY